jgi:hypothetical protein
MCVSKQLRIKRAGNTTGSYEFVFLCGPFPEEVVVDNKNACFPELKLMSSFDNFECNNFS